MLNLLTCLIPLVRCIQFCRLVVYKQETHNDGGLNLWADQRQHIQRLHHLCQLQILEYLQRSNGESHEKLDLHAMARLDPPSPECNMIPAPPAKPPVASLLLVSASKYFPDQRLLRLDTLPTKITYAYSLLSQINHVKMFTRKNSFGGLLNTSGTILWSLNAFCTFSGIGSQQQKAAVITSTKAVLMLEWIFGRHVCTVWNVKKSFANKLSQ